MTWKWQYKVVKVGRGMRGEWFSFPTASTHETAAEAVEAARRFAAEQAAVLGGSGFRYTVRSRRGNRLVADWRISSGAPVNHCSAGLT